MDSSDQMPKVDFSKDKLLSASTQEWMKIVEAQNRDRVLKLQKLRRRNLITGLLLGATSVGIYTYTILTVKQETFLDDFEEPKLKEVQ